MMIIMALFIVRCIRTWATLLGLHHFFINPSVVYLVSPSPVEDRKKQLVALPSMAECLDRLLFMTPDEAASCLASNISQGSYAESMEKLNQLLAGQHTACDGVPTHDRLAVQNVIDAEIRKDEEDEEDEDTDGIIYFDASRRKRNLSKSPLLNHLAAVYANAPSSHGIFLAGSGIPVVIRTVLSNSDSDLISSRRTRSLSPSSPTAQQGGMASAPLQFAETLRPPRAKVSLTQEQDERRWRSRVKAGITTLRRLLMKHAKFVGPGILTSVAYFDPGNWATGIAAGSSNGYSQLFVVLLAGCMGIFLQVLACRLGAVSGLDLAQQCRAHMHNRPKNKMLWRWLACYPLYAVCETAIIFTDLAELLGSAIAVNLIFPVIPLYAGVLLTSLDVLLILTFFNDYPSPTVTPTMRFFEFGVAALVITVLSSFIVLIVRIDPNWGQLFLGYVPSNAIFQNAGLFNAVGIIGATVMPHAIFLGSKLATTDRLAEYHDEKHPPIGQSVTRDGVRDLTGQNDTQPPSLNSEPHHRHHFHSAKADSILSTITSHVGHGTVDLGLSLFGCALVINSAILIFSAAAFYYGAADGQGGGVGGDLFGAFDLIRDKVGYPFAILFAVALLISGQLASITATLAGQIVSEGFLQWRIKPWKRRLVTRLIGIVPSLIIAVSVGRQGIDKLLVTSQVALSIVLPFVIVPLMWFTSSKTLMSVQVPNSSPELEAYGHGTATAHSDGQALPSGWRTWLKSRFGSTTPQNPLDAEATGFTSVSFANHPIVVIAGFLIFLVICVANVYALVQLGQSH